jgi:hypothetical protein
MDEKEARYIEKRAARLMRYYDAGFYKDFLYASRAKRLASKAVSAAYANKLEEANLLMIEAEQAWKQAGGKSL